MYPYDKNKLAELKQTIKNFVAFQRATLDTIPSEHADYSTWFSALQSTLPDPIWKWNSDSRVVRHLLLAYGILRGKPYRSMEQSTRDDNRPNPHLILSALVYYSGADPNTWNIDKVKEMLQ
jgi:hypothetical protein